MFCERRPLSNHLQNVKQHPQDLRRIEQLSHYRVGALASAPAGLVVDLQHQLVRTMIIAPYSLGSQKNIDNTCFKPIYNTNKVECSQQLTCKKPADRRRFKKLTCKKPADRRNFVKLLSTNPLSHCKDRFAIETKLDVEPES